MSNKRGRPRKQIEESISFTYIGDPDNNNDGPNIVRPYGYEFLKNGPAVTVTEQFVIKKLKGNRHFGYESKTSN